MSELRQNFALIKADIQFNAIQNKTLKKQPETLKQNLGLFLENVCLELDRPEIDVQTKVSELLSDFKKLEKCAEEGFESFMMLVLK